MGVHGQPAPQERHEATPVDVSKVPEQPRASSQDSWLWAGQVKPGVPDTGVQGHPAWLADLQVLTPLTVVPLQLASEQDGAAGLQVGGGTLDVDVLLVVLEAVLDDVTTVLVSKVLELLGVFETVLDDEVIVLVSVVLDLAVVPALDVLLGVEELEDAGLADDVIIDVVVWLMTLVPVLDSWHVFFGHVLAANVLNESTNNQKKRVKE